MSIYRIAADAATGSGAPRRRRRARATEEKGGAEQLAAGGAGGRGGGGDGGGGAGGNGALSQVVDRVTKWIPGDVLALYVAAVTAFASKANSRPSIVLLIVFVVLSGILVPLTTFASTGSIPAKTFIPGALAAVAFAIWSLSVPQSGWQRWDAVHDNQAAVAVVAAIVALIFALVAEGITKMSGSGT